MTNSSAMNRHLFVTSKKARQSDHQLTQLTLVLLLLLMFECFEFGQSASSSSSFSILGSAAENGAVGSTVSTSASGGNHGAPATYAASGGGGGGEVGTGRGLGEYCLKEWFNASCVDIAGSKPHRRVPSDGLGDDALSVVVMATAFYGRMRSGRCIQMKYGQAGCRTDVLGQLDDECSGRPSCRFPVSKLLSSVVSPCDGELTPYLEAGYSCVRVPRGICSSTERHKTLNTQTGYLSIDSQLSSPPGLSQSPSVAGTQRCPWRIVVDPQQRIRIILYSFGSRNYVQQDQHEEGQGHGSASSSSSCSAFVIFDGVTERSLCQSAGARQMVLHTSDSHQLTVHFRFSGNQQQQSSASSSFILYYEAVGCPTLKIPSFDGSSGIGAWVKQQDAGTAVVKCNSTDETWYLRCDGRQWKGHIGNCTTILAMATPNDAEPRTSPSAGSLSFGLIMAVIVGVLLGVIIGAVPLAMAYVCLKRKWRQSPPEGYIHGNEEDVYDPVAAGKTALMTTARATPHSGTTIHHQHHMQFAGMSPSHHQMGHGPPAYCVNVGGLTTTHGTYPPFQQYCTGSFHHRHSPNCCTAEDGVEVDQTSAAMTLTTADILDRGQHGGGCQRLEHVYESASVGGVRVGGVRNHGQRLVGFVDEQIAPPSGTLYNGGGTAEMIATTVICPLHYDVTVDGGKMVA